MFKKIEGVPLGRTISMTVNGEPLRVERGTTLAIALLQAGCVPTRRHPVDRQARAPYCLMGACFECLVHIGGETNVQSCQVKVYEGMVVRLPNGRLEMER